MSGLEDRKLKKILKTKKNVNDTLTQTNHGALDENENRTLIKICAQMKATVTKLESTVANLQLRITDLKSESTMMKVTIDKLSKEKNQPGAASIGSTLEKHKQTVRVDVHKDQDGIAQIPNRKTLLCQLVLTMSLQLSQIVLVTILHPV